MPNPKKKPAPKKKGKAPSAKTGAMPFGQRLKAWRQAQKPPLSQSEAAAHFGLQVQTLQSWEQGIRNPSLILGEAILTQLIKEGF